VLTDLPHPGRPVWQYVSTDRHRLRVGVALLASATLHGLVFFGWPKPLPPAPPSAPPVLALTFTMPDLKQLEDAEPAPRDDAAIAEPGVVVPMLADLPQVARPSDFVQRIDFSSLLEKPDLNAAKVFAIPDASRRVAQLAQGFGPIFNLSDLDRIPEVIFQPAPIYPFAVRREGISVEVRVEFIVDTVGTVRSPVVAFTTDPRFNEAATTGVAKWRFRPGVRSGQRVNTRMMVPVIFSIVDPDA
jgi:protein TonB